MSNKAFSKIWIAVILVALIAGGFLTWQYLGGIKEEVGEQPKSEGKIAEEKSKEEKPKSEGEIALELKYPEEYLIYQDYLGTIGGAPRVSDVGVIEGTVISITRSEACPYPEEKCRIEPYPKDIGVVRIDKIIEYTSSSASSGKQPIEGPSEPSGEGPSGEKPFTNGGYRGEEPPSPKPIEYEPLQVGQEIPVSFLLTTRPVKVRYVSIPPAGKPKPGIESVMGQSAGVVCGDVNCDKKVDSDDVTLLQNYVSHPGKYTICSEWAADVTCDGKINMGDVTLLFNHVNSPENDKYALRCCSKQVIEGCPDINGDGKVSVADQLILAQTSGKCSGDEGYDGKADLTGDNCVNQDDLDVLTKYFHQFTTCAQIAACPDINSDNKVSVADLLLIAQSWYLCQGQTGYNSKADLTGDNCVNNGDLIVLKKYYHHPVDKIPECQVTEVCGDVNCDKKVDSDDVTLLQNYVSHPGKYTICSEWAADVTCDGKINMGDVTLLFNHVNSPENDKYALRCCKGISHSSGLGGEPLPKTYKPIPREGKYFVFTTKIIEYPKTSEKILPGLEIGSKFRAKVHYAGSLYVEEYEIVP